MEYAVVLTEQAERELHAVSSASALERLAKSKDLLKTSPEIGRLYDPEYEAARPPSLAGSFPSLEPITRSTMLSTIPGKPSSYSR